MLAPQPVIKPHNRHTRRFVRSLLGFSVGVGVGLAPFLGNIDVPGFKPLLSLFPDVLRATLLPMSAFLMGVIAAATQFYDRHLKRSSLKIIATSALLVLVAAFLSLAIVHTFVVDEARFGDAVVVTEVIGGERLKSCECPPGMTDEECLQEVSTNPNRGKKTCWSGGAIKRNELVLKLLYFLLTSSFALFVGMIVLQEGRDEATARGRAQNPPKKKKPARPKRGVVPK